MNIVLLSGGSGKRLWPLSNDIRSKQFIKFFKAEDGSYESMAQRIYKQICRVDENAVVTIATSKAQISTIRNQLGDKVSLSIEPCRRDTFPAIALATAYLHDVQGISEDETVIICPVDPYVNDDYFMALKELGKLADSGNCNLALLGMEPTYPSENFGYIMPVDKNKISNVSSFKEKPNKEKAEEYISQGALWNGGVFAYKIKYVLEKAHELIDFTDYQDLYDKYETLEKISFDYAVVEKEDKIQVMRFNGQWIDLGTWNALADTMEDKSVGEAILNETCEDVYVINELDETMIEKFKTTFDLVNEEFKTVFKKLFRGGTGKLILTDEEDLLNTGVDIIASPPGKNLKSLNMLSGGEKTLTAIALLFSILNIRIVPFCILDEVEAALDEANVDMFGTYLSEYKDKTQFIIITHKKRTMEYAKTLYGITMQESGVSKLVSVRLDDIK